MTDPRLRQDQVASQATEDAALARLEELFRIVGSEEARFETIAVHAMSPLAIERRAAPRQPLEYRVRNYVGAATDNLATLRTVLCKGLPMIGSYSIIRAAIEACALGIWAADPGTRDARIFRILHMGWHELLRVDDLAKKLKRPPVDLEAARRRHEQLKNDRKGNRQKSLDTNPSSMTDILLHVERKVRFQGEFGPLVAWTICSSMAHGNQAMQQAVLERRYLGDHDGTGGMWHVTSSFGVNALLLEPAVAMLTHLVDRYEHLAQPESGRRHAGEGA